MPIYIADIHPWDGYFERREEYIGKKVSKVIESHPSISYLVPWRKELHGLKGYIGGIVIIDCNNKNKYTTFAAVMLVEI